MTAGYKYSANGIQYSSYRVQKGEEMRIDLVCKSIYGNIDYVDIILNVNNISNPLNIKEGTVIIYPDQSNIELLRFTEKAVRDDAKIVSNPNKSNRIDPTRQKYVEVGSISSSPNNFGLSDDQISTSGGLLKVGNNLFNR